MGYLRFLMPMECEATGYGFKGRIPAGRCLVENRDGEGKITVWAQDIKPETRYGVYVVFPDEGRFAGVFVGNVNACEKGKIEARHGFAQNIIGKFVMGDFVAVAVVAEATGSVISPLCGYRDRPVSWRNSFFVATEEQNLGHLVEALEEPAPVVVEEAPAPEPVVEEPIPEPVEEAPAPEPVPEPVTEETTPEPIPEPIAEETTPAPVIEEAPSEPAAQRVRARQTAPRARKPKEPGKTPRRTGGNSENTRAVEAIFGSKPSEAPFENADGTQWVRLTISDAVPLPDNRPQLLEEPFVRAAYANYAHLMLGITEDNSDYILAVPGEYAPDLKAQAKRMGFTKFKPTAGKTAKHGDFGYWLMFVPM